MSALTASFVSSLWTLVLIGFGLFIGHHTPWPF